MAKQQHVPSIILLAAGQGKRMRSELPKVLHSIGGQALLFHILDRVREVAPQSPVAIVVGHAREKVEKAVRECPEFSSMDITFVHQPEQRGTGHAALYAMESPWGMKRIETRSSVLVLPGDLPLLPAQLLKEMLEPLHRGAAMRLLTCEFPDPTGYGRVVRKGKKGSVLRIAEEKDANLREKSIHEVAASIYTFQSSFLKFALQRLSNKNAQGEYYLTDTVAIAARGKKIEVLPWRDPEDLRGVNDPWELSLAERILRSRCVEAWARKGVRFVDPAAVQVDISVELAEEVVIDRGAILRGKTRVGRGTVIGPYCVLTDMVLGERTHVKTGTVGEDSEVGNDVNLGPYAHLRPGSVVASHAKIGNFVELKKSRIGEKTSVAHLSYLGDAEVGKNVNIGCGFITCNFDGRVIDGERKHKTVIEDDVFVGSDCQTVAPIRLGRGSYIASGSTVTEDVPADSLAIARSRQVVKPGYAQKLRAK